MKRIPSWKQNTGASLRRFIAQMSLRFSGDFWACDMHVLHVIMYINYFTVKLKNSSLAKATLTFYIQWLYCVCQGDIMKIQNMNFFYEVQLVFRMAGHQANWTVVGMILPTCLSRRKLSSEIAWLVENNFTWNLLLNQ